MTPVALSLKAHAVHIDLAEIQVQPSGAACLALAASKAGKQDKAIAADLGMQDSVWSRCKSGQNSLSLEQLVTLCEVTGTLAPIAWMLVQLGYDPRTLRRMESEVETRNRELEERVRELEREREIERRLVRDLMSRAG